MSPKERISYIWEYYKFHIMGSIGAIILLISLISSIGDKKEAYLNMTILGKGIDSEGIVQVQEQLTNKLVKDKEKEEVFVETLTYDPSSQDEISRAGIQKMTAQITTGSIDLLIVDKELFEEITSLEKSLLALNEIKAIDKSDFELVYSKTSDENFFGIGTSDIKLLDSLGLDENKVLCVPSNTKKMKEINEFFTLISE
jgi:hypothetical protein